MPALPEHLKATYDGIKNIGVACLIFKLKKSITPHFWVNVADDRIAIPGFVEFSNLHPTRATIIFVPFYMPVTNPKWAHRDEELLSETPSAPCRRMNAFRASENCDAFIVFRSFPATGKYRGKL